MIWTKALIAFIGDLYDNQFKANISFTGSFIVTFFHVNISQLQYMLSLSQILSETPKTQLL